MSHKFPSQLNLQAICEQWQVSYEYVSQTGISFKQITEPPMPYELIMQSPTKNRKILLQALEFFLKQKAKRHLRQWLQAISDDMNLPFRRCIIRGQKTRWGSCSEDNNINLNYKLLFLPARFVEYILLHELCHTQEFNHSPKFWQLVASYMPNYREIDKAVRKAHEFLPTWSRM